MSDLILAKIKIEEFYEELYVKPISENLFSFEETSFLNPDLHLGVIAELKLTKNGEYELIKIVEKSKFVKHDWILTKQFIESKEFDELKTLIIDLGGTWEQIMLGSFIAHIPSDTNEKFVKEIDKFHLNLKNNF